MKNFSVQQQGFDYSFQFEPKTGNAAWALNLGYSSGSQSDFNTTSGIEIISGQSGIGNSMSLVPPYLLLGNVKEEAVEVYYNQSLELITGQKTFEKINRLTGNGFTGSSGFGHTLRGREGSIAVGAPNSEINSTPDAGAVFVFIDYLTGGDGATGNDQWGQLTAFSGRETGALYGSSVDIVESNTNFLLTVGAPGESSGSGALYLHDASTDALIQKITPTGSGVQNFGKDVQLAEKDSIRYILSSYDHGGTGKIDIFKESQPNLNDFTKHQTINPSEGNSGDMYGYTISSFSGSFLVGAPEIGGSGKVYYYTFNNEDGIFAESQKIYPSTLGAGNLFGKSLDFDGDHAIITASEDSGKGYIYKLTSGAFEFVSAVSGSLTTMAGAFGGNISGFKSSAINGDTIVAGEDNSPLDNNYIYYFSTGRETLTEYTGVSLSGSGGKLFDSDNNFIYGYSAGVNTLISGSVLTDGSFTVFVNNTLCNSSSPRSAGTGFTGALNSWSMTGEDTLASYSLKIFSD